MTRSDHYGNLAKAVDDRGLWLTLSVRDGRPDVLRVTEPKRGGRTIHTAAICSNSPTGIDQAAQILLARLEGAPR